MSSDAKPLAVRVTVTIGADVIADADERQRAEDNIASWLAGICQAALPMCFEGPYVIEDAKEGAPQ